MKIRQFIFYLFCINSTFTYAQNSLKGKITDASSGESLPGVTVFITQLKLGTISDSSGTYNISHLPKGSFTVEAKLLSYGTVVKQITINGLTSSDFSLSTSSTNVQEVVITALGNVTNTFRSPTPVTLVAHDQFVMKSSTNVVDAIATQPGVTAITTGPGISKPEINGLGFNRVLTLLDGVRQEDFQWGDEHGILIDPYAVYDAEIIKGPASLQYGANAMAGVVSFKSQPYPENGIIQGSLSSEYQSNNGLIGNSLDFGGNNHGLIWDIRASNEDAHCYWNTKDGYVWGTAFTQTNVRVVVQVNKNWGYSRLTISDLQRQIEIPDGNRDSATGQFQFDTPQPIPGHGNPQYYSSANSPNPALIGTLIPGTGQVYPNMTNFLSYSPNISGYQILNHTIVSWQNSINLEKGRLGIDLGYTQSIRHEVDTGSIGEENMTVHDLPYSFKYQVEGDSSGLKLTTGINGMYEYMINFPEPPSPYIGDFEIPNYTDFDIGGYAILQKDYKNLTLSGGLRYDSRSMVGQSLYLANDNEREQLVIPSGGVSFSNGNYFANSNQEIVSSGTSLYQQFPSFNRTFTGFSGSIGASYQLPENYYVKLNLGRSYRAPSISELTSNELDPSNIYRLGDPNLKAEAGLQTDIAFGYIGKDVSIEVDGFYNIINNFIFPSKLASNLGGDSINLGAPVYKYTGTNTAILAGIEGFINIHPSTIRWIELDNGFTYIYSFLRGGSDSTDHVPWTPAPRLISEMKIKLPNAFSFLSKTYIKFGLAHYWAQNDIYRANYNELPSFAYTLYDAGIGTNFVSKKSKRTVCSLIINCTNLMNIAYVDHTSREQYFWAYNGPSTSPVNYGLMAAVVTKQSEGIYNMGRNAGFKLIIPINAY